MRMLDGFNEGWIEFEQGESKRRKGGIGLKEVLKKLADGKYMKSARPAEQMAWPRIWVSKDMDP